jgi:heterodisulfide reductase subunit B
MPPGGDSQFAHLQCPLGNEKKSLASIVVACPLWHVNLDPRQKQIEEEFKETFQLPILYLLHPVVGIGYRLEVRRAGS